jgi:hypothetical protein
MRLLPQQVKRAKGLIYDSTAVLELDLNMTGEEALAECREHRLVVRSERELAGRAGSHHWHLGFPGRPGTLELSEWQGRVWVKVHPRRNGSWATRFARELESRSRKRHTA